MIITVPLILASHNNNTYGSHYTSPFFSRTDLGTSWEGKNIQGFLSPFLPPISVLIATEFVVPASVTVLLIPSSSLTISTSSGIYWHPPTSLFRRKNLEGCFSLCLSERKRWTQLSEFPSFSQQGGLHVVGHSKKHDFHRASGSSQISQQGTNPWPLLRLQSCA